MAATIIQHRLLHDDARGAMHTMLGHEQAKAVHLAPRRMGGAVAEGVPSRAGVQAGVPSGRSIDGGAPEAAFELVGAGTAAANGPYRQDGAHQLLASGLPPPIHPCRPPVRRLLLTVAPASGARRRVQGQAALLQSGRPLVEGAA